MQASPNLSMAKQKALRHLVKDDSLIISEANMGDVVVVPYTAAYLQLAYEHLGDWKTYQLLNTDPTVEIVKQFTEYLKTCKVQVVITTHEYYKLEPTKKVDTQTIYFLPKVHKE